MKSSALAVLAGVTLASCAGMEVGDCKGADWYDLAFRDAIFGLQAQDQIYSMECARYGIPIDAARYAEGYQDGRAEFERRRASSGVD